MIGAMAHTMCGDPAYTGMVDWNADYTLRMKRLVSFLTGGFRAGVPGSEEK
jgi:hypothetical protein